MNLQNNNKTLQTGESYCLSEIFSDDKKIYIPDLQRDYCWGDGEKEGNKVYGFLKSLMQIYLKQKSNNVKERIHLGLLYGYMEEYNPNRVMLCDGQQRLTSLFLIIGMLNRLSGDNAFRNLLISDRELQEDDREPYLQYAIRETTMAFLSDLVCHFFICDEQATASLLSIKQERWYYSQYSFDPSIQSMIGAMTAIQYFIEEQESNGEYSWTYNDLMDFGEFISTSLLFMYYDMGSRSDGEKTFVVINNSGEPLTRMENLKPFMVRNTCDCEKWENMEDWFWKHRSKFDTSDPGMNEFFRLVMYLETRNNTADSEEKTKILAKLLSNKEYEFPHGDISLDIVIQYFEAYKRLKLNSVYEDKQEQKIYAWLIPSLLFAKKFDTACDDDMVRVKHAFKNTTIYRNHYKLENALSLVEAMSSPDVLAFLDCPNELLKYDEREELTTKLKVIKINIDSRTEIETAFNEAEKHGVWHGEIKMLIDWAGGYEAFCLETFKKLYANSVLLFGDAENSCKNVPINPNTLRLLLSYEIADIMMNGYWLYNAGIEWKAYLAKKNKKQLFYRLLRETDSDQALKEHLDDYNDTTNFYYPLIKDGTWFEHSWYRHICKINCNLAVIQHRCQQKDHFKDVFLVGCSRLNSWERPNFWSRFFYNGECIYTRNNNKGIGINIHGDQSGIYFYLYSTKADGNKSPEMVEILKKYQFETTDGQFFRSDIVNVRESDAIISLIHEIMRFAN